MQGSKHRDILTALEDSRSCSDIGLLVQNSNSVCMMPQFVTTFDLSSKETIKPGVEVASISLDTESEIKLSYFVLLLGITCGCVYLRTPDSKMPEQASHKLGIGYRCQRIENGRMCDSFLRFTPKLIRKEGSENQR